MNKKHAAAIGMGMTAAAIIGGTILLAGCAVDVGPTPYHHHYNYGPEYDRGYIGGFVSPTFEIGGGHEHHHNFGEHHERHRDHR
jgi:hypothetical protein